MTTRRRKLLALTLLAVIGGVIAYSLLRESDEPKYQGRRLSEWLEQYYEKELLARDGREFHEANAAVLNIGTNAVPYLVKWIDFEPGAWRETLRKKLPGFITKGERVDRWLEGEANRRATYAHLGFGILGSNAVSAAPELAALMKDTSRPQTSRRAFFSLLDIGEFAMPAVAAVLEKPTQSNMWTATFQPEGRFRLYFRPQAVAAYYSNASYQLNQFDRAVLSMATNSVRASNTNILTNTEPK